jgi:hypothetical protein
MILLFINIKFKLTLIIKLKIMIINQLNNKKKIKDFLKKFINYFKIKIFL